MEYVVICRDKKGGRENKRGEIESVLRQANFVTELNSLCG